MAILRWVPDSVISAGNWQCSTCSTGSDTHDDDTNEDYEGPWDGNIAFFNSGALGRTLKMSLTDTADPGVDEGFFLGIRHRRTGSSQKINYKILEGLTIIYQTGLVIMPKSWTTKTFEIPASNIANITDFTNLDCIFEAESIGLFPAPTLRVNAFNLVWEGGLLTRPILGVGQ